MVSTTMTVAIMAIAATCFIVVAHATLGEKCKFDMQKLTEEEHKFIAECYAEVTGKPMDKDTRKEDLSDDDKEKMCACVTGKIGIFGSDGKFDADKAKTEVARIETDDVTRKAILDGIDSCASAGGDEKTIQECLREVMKVCEA